VIEFRDVSLTYLSRSPLAVEALNGLCWKWEKGESVALLGTTGSGKSTLARCCNGLLLPTKGKVFVEGWDTSAKRNGALIRRKVGMVFQSPERQFFCPTCFEECAFALQNFEPQRNVEQAVQQAFQWVGLSPDLFSRSPFRLSGGQQRLLAIASVLVYGPDYLVLDEPTSGLDAPSRERIFHVLRALQANGLGLLLVTHDMEFLPKILHRVIVLKNGEMVFEGTLDQLFSRAREGQQWGLAFPSMVRYSNARQARSST